MTSNSDQPWWFTTCFVQILYSISWLGLEKCNFCIVNLKKVKIWNHHIEAETKLKYLDTRMLKIDWIQPTLQPFELYKILVRGYLGHNGTVGDDEEDHFDSQIYLIRWNM